MSEENKNMLNVQDMITIAKIIEVSARRGGIQAGEMVVAGEVYNKLVAFLKSSGAIEPTPPESDTTPNKETKND